MTKPINVSNYLMEIIGDVFSPYPGMMCYDMASKTVAIFDGTQWSYWN